jgi:FkbM family methyltransferase
MIKRLLDRFQRKPAKEISSDLATEADIYYCYRLLLNREPDQAGFDFWSRQINGPGITLRFLTNGFLNSKEFLSRHFGSMYAYILAASSQVQLVELDDFRIYVRGNDLYIGAPIARGVAYEDHVAQQVRRNLKPGDVFVDVGANIGYFSLLAASIVGVGGKVIAFEPNVANCELLKLSIKQNEFEQIEVYNNAVAECDQDFILEVEGSNGWLVPLEAANSTPFYISEKYDNSSEHIQRFLTKAVTLDNVLEDVPRIDLIKIDIEGAEPRALQGMNGILQKHRPVLFTEFYPAMLQTVSGVTPEAYLDKLREIGYDIFIIESDYISPAFQNNRDLLERFTNSQVNHLDIAAYPK